MKPLLSILLFLTSASVFALEIKDGTYENREHFIITTKSATYYFDKAGGGFSRMLDKKGNDWIAFNMSPWDKAPESAASSYRGIPNAVFKEADGGCGHPGFDMATSIKESANAIRTKSKSEKWEWLYTFYEDYVCWEILKTDETRKYWLLYEGPVGGTYLPEISYWGNNEGGPLFNTPNHLSGERNFGNWEWAYFGRTDRNQTLFIAQQNVDGVEDFFSYMGSSREGIKAADGMVVFGFGRAVGSKPLLSGTNKYVFGFWNTEVTNTTKHQKLSKFITTKVNQLHEKK